MACTGNQGILFAHYQGHLSAVHLHAKVETLGDIFFFAFFKIVYINCQKLRGTSLDTSSIGLLCGIFASENQDPGTPPPGPEKLNRCHRPAGSSPSDSGLSCVLQRWLLHRSEHRDSRLSQTVTASGDENAGSQGTSPGFTADLAV